ncbi:MAG: hypothetical protein WBE47_09895, partial [Candidatus Acidiferrales bacterium]
MGKTAIIFGLFAAVALLTAEGPVRHNSKPDSTTPRALATADSSVTIGGEPAVTLKRPEPVDRNKPQFLEAIVLPGNGMNLLQVKAYLPGKGDI